MCCAVHCPATLCWLLLGMEGADLSQWHGLTGEGDQRERGGDRETLHHCRLLSACVSVKVRN